MKNSIFVLILCLCPLFAEADIQLYEKDYHLGQIEVGRTYTYKLKYLSAGNSPLYVYLLKHGRQTIPVQKGKLIADTEMQKNQPQKKKEKPAKVISIKNIENTIVSEFEGEIYIDIVAHRPVAIKEEITIITNTNVEAKFFLKGNAVIHLKPEDVIDEIENAWAGQPLMLEDVLKQEEETCMKAKQKKSCDCSSEYEL